MPRMSRAWRCVRMGPAKVGAWAAAWIAHRPALRFRSGGEIVVEGGEGVGGSPGGFDVE